MRSIRLLLPVHTPPHKEAEDDPGVEARVELCELAVAGDPRPPAFATRASLSSLGLIVRRAPQPSLTGDAAPPQMAPRHDK